MNNKYQNIVEFIKRPFGKYKPNTSKYDEFYKKYIKEKSLYIKDVVSDKERNVYYFHIKVPSDSMKEESYDVVIQFFTTENSLEKNKNRLDTYYIQFYSNSPGFIFKYASLYYLYGYLINSFYGKMEEEFKHKTPDISNPKYEMCYDKSIYLACKYLLDNRLNFLLLQNIRYLKNISLDKLIEEVRDFETVKTDRELLGIEHSLNRELEKDRLKAIKQEEFNKKNNPIKKILSNFIKPKSKIVAKPKTSKIKAKKSTKKIG